MLVGATLDLQVSPLFVLLPGEDSPADQSAWAWETARELAQRSETPLSEADVSQLVGLLSGHAEVHRQRRPSTAGFVAISDPSHGVDAYLQVKQGTGTPEQLSVESLERLDVNATPQLGRRLIERLTLASGPAVRQFSHRDSSFNLLSGAVRSEQYFVLPPERPDLFIMFHAEWMESYFDEAIHEVLRMMADTVKVRADR